MRNKKKKKRQRSMICLNAEIKPKDSEINGVYLWLPSSPDHNPP